MTFETKTERWALYAELRRERYGSERPIDRRPITEDPGVLMRRVRDLMAAVGDEAI